MSDESRKKTDEELKAEFLELHGATKCPPSEMQDYDRGKRAYAEYILLHAPKLSVTKGNSSKERQSALAARTHGTTAIGIDIISRSIKNKRLYQ
jgi:hypothetical protein